MARALAHHLRDVHGVERGDRVAIAMRNYPEWVVGLLGDRVARCRGGRHERVVDESRDGVRPRRLAPQGADRRRRAPRAGDPDLAGAARRPRRCTSSPCAPIAWCRTIRTRSRRAGPTWCTSDGAPATLPDADIDPDDDACIFYTSGTTGFPKGAQLTHRGSVHNVMNLLFMGHGRDHRRSAGAGGRGWRRRRGVELRAAPARVHGADPAVPRHRLQLPAPPGHVAGRHDRAHAQVGSGPGPRADRARARHELLGCADDEPRAAVASRLEHP